MFYNKLNDLFMKSIGKKKAAYFSRTEKLKLKEKTSF